MKTHTKEVVQYATAVAMIASGIVLAFLSFFFNHHDIETGVLMYIAQALVYAGGIFGVSLYFRTKLLEAETRIRRFVSPADGGDGAAEENTDKKE